MARKLEKQVEKEILRLGMRNAKFKIALHSFPPHPGDFEKI